jgi:hypothetical protein
MFNAISGISKLHSFALLLVVISKYSKFDLTKGGIAVSASRSRTVKNSVNHVTVLVSTSAFSRGFSGGVFASFSAIQKFLVIGYIVQIQLLN